MTADSNSLRLRTIIVASLSVTAVAVAAVIGATLAPLSGPGAVVVRVVAVLAAVAGGGPIVRSVFIAAPPIVAPVATGALHGGRVIGYLERAAVVTTVLTGWPEGLAVALAVKSLARYPELRDAHVGEQFIIGTFTSVLWALGCAGTAQLLLT